MTEPIQLIAGLGNPGVDYANTRHNAGAWFIDLLLASTGGVLKTESRFQCQVASVQVGNQTVRVIVPTTFMNHSGRAVGSIAHFYKIPASAILVVYDELDLDAGVARLKIGGGAGGHNGVRDIMNVMGSPDFLRARIGIGHPGHKTGVTNYVLGRPSAVDYEKIQTALTSLLAVLPSIVKGDVPAAMQNLHTTV